ncbi:MAG: transporter substrate-binding domain-containing protein, partial [Deltaproteobacteria bacterium]|nr:transporter substrate-binding domain-containing protein [Deltaproteobacteria bacterium]
FITRNNAHCYYTYRDQKMGFEYDLASAFADYLGVKLKIIIIEKWEEMIPKLMDGKGHVIAASLTITPKRKNIIMFSKKYMTIQQQIIVNRENYNIRKLEDLSEKNIHVRRGTSYEERLKELQKKQCGHAEPSLFSKGSCPRLYQQKGTYRLGGAS